MKKYLYILTYPMNNMLTIDKYDHDKECQSREWK